MFSKLRIKHFKVNSSAMVQFKVVIIITHITEDLRKPLPHSRPISVPLTALTSRVKLYTASSLILKITRFPRVCDYLKLSQVQRFERYHQVFSSLSQKQTSDTKEEHRGTQNFIS